MNLQNKSIIGNSETELKSVLRTNKILTSDLSLNKIYQIMTLINLENIDHAVTMLDVTKRSLLKTLDNVEKALDILIINKKTNSAFVEITKDGLEFMNYAKNIFKELSDVTEKLKNKNNITNSNISIAINFNDTKLLKIDEAIINFKNKNPEINITIATFKSNTRIEKYLTDGIFNIGILSESLFNKEIEYIKLISSPWVIVGKKQIKNHWTKLKFIFSNYIFIQNIRSTNKDFFEHNYNNFFGDKIIVEVYDDNQALKLAEKGIGAVFIDKKIAQPYLDNGSLEIISEPPFKFDSNVYIGIKIDLYKNSIFHSFITELCNVYKE